MSILKSETLAKLAPALVKAQKTMTAALKDSNNPFFKSKYADLNAVMDACIPNLNDQGIAVLQAPNLKASNDGNSFVPVIQTIFLHESGEFIASEAEVVAAKQNDPQSAGSASTYACRYGLRAMAALKTEIGGDDDGEKAMQRNKPSIVAAKAEVAAERTASVEKPKTTGFKPAASGGGFKAASKPTKTLF